MPRVKTARIMGSLIAKTARITGSIAGFVGTWHYIAANFHLAYLR